MRICILSNPNYLHAQRWARYFIKQGHEVCIVGDRGAAPLQLPDIKTVVMEDDLFRGPWILRTTLALKRLLDQSKPDILHMHYLGPLVAPVILRYRPFVVSVWGSDIVGETGVVKDDWRGRFLKRVILRCADAVTATSCFLADATREYARLPRDRVSVYPWGVDLRQFVRDGARREESVVIGFAKGLDLKYGAEYLLRAVPIIRARHREIRVLLLGDGVLRQHLEQLARDLGVAEVVTFCGWVAHEDVPRRMGEMDVFVMPSVSESFGVAALEAQAMGIPVVASNVGGIPEAVADGVTGILVSPRDPQAIASAVMRLVEDRRLRESMSQAGPRFVAERYDWDKNAARFEALYTTLLEATR